MENIRYSDNNLILDSGSLLAFSSTSDIQFDIKMSEHFSFNLTFKFESNGKKEYDIKSSIQGNNIVITCINFDNPLGTGTNKPLPLATFGGKQIFLNFWVYGLGNNSARKIIYTLYKEK